MSQELTLVIIIVSIILLVGIAIISNVKSPKDKAQIEYIKSKLGTLSNRIKSENSDVVKFAYIETDKLLDTALKFKGLKGNTLGERLKYSRKFFNSELYNKVWEAHKLKNRLIHEEKINIDTQKLRKSFLDLRRGIEVISQ